MKVILIAASDTIVAAQIGSIVEEMGHHATYAEDAGDAFGYLDADGLADLVIAELGEAPTFNGLVLARVIRQRRLHLPFILLTDEPHPPQDEAVADYLTKGFLPSDVVRSIRAAL